MKYHALFVQKAGKISQNLSSAAVVIGALSFHKQNFLILANDCNFYMLSEENHQHLANKLVLNLICIIV